jgi:acyl dehydratase
MAFGRYFEDFTVGERMRHWPGRTIGEADNTWFSLLSMNQHPVHVDAHYAATRTDAGRPLVVGTLVFAVAVGLTVADVSGRSIANLDYEWVRHHAPTFAGDTLYAESEVLDTRLSDTKPDRGVVYVETRVTNQRGELVMSFRRHVLIPTRDHPALGEVALGQRR